MDLINFAKGTSMQTDVQSETYDLPGYAIDDTSQYTGKEGLTFIDSATAWDEDAQELTVFVIEEYNFVKHIELCDQDLDAKNSFEEPDRIKPVENLGGSFAGGILSAHVKPLSWNVFRFEKKKA